MGEEKGDDEDNEVEDDAEGTHGLTQVMSSHVVLWHVLIQQEEHRRHWHNVSRIARSIEIFCKYYLTSGTQFQQ